MAFRRYRRLRRIPRIRRRRFRGAALRKIKRDILKCNFPTKVKFIGLPEKKVMFLTRQTVIQTKAEYPSGDFAADKRTLFLYPTECRNFRTLYKKGNITRHVGENDQDMKSAAIFSNWDKYCVLAVYIRVQPQINMFDGNGEKTITPVKCYYAMNNNVIFQNNMTDSDHTIEQLLGLYNEQMLEEKPLFTFNSNENFTFVLRAPQTMQTDTPVVHKKYTWWSIVDQAIIANGDTIFSGAASGKYATMQEDIEPEENECLPFSTPLIGFRSKELPAIHCGHLFFTTEDNIPVKLNVTINYKIALKG